MLQFRSRPRLRWAAFAITASLALMASPPASAQFGFGIGPGMYFGDEGEDYGGACLSDYLLRQSLAKSGYSDIFMGLDNDHHVTVRASRGGVVYKLLVNSCSGKILSRERDRRRN
jgi:hypothetical protein